MEYSIEDIIKYDAESHKLDFKREQYLLGKNEKKAELLKDVLSFANHPSNEYKFIIMGVDEKSKEILGIQNPVDEAQYREYISKNIEPEINFEYRIINLAGKKISYFKIFDNKNRPYLFNRDLPNSKYNLGDGYIRFGTSTKKIGREELGDIYRNRFNQKDRKKDLIVTPYAKENDDYKKEGVKFYNLEVSIENISSRSIDLYVELKFDLGLGIVPEFDLKRFDQMNKQSYNSFGFPFQVQPLNFNFLVHSNETESHILFERHGALGKGLILKQNDIEIKVFQGSIMLWQISTVEIKGSLCIRSDAFLEGPLVEELVFKI